MLYNDNKPVWEDDITVIGPVSISSNIRFDTRKDPQSTTDHIANRCAQWYQGHY
jgi:hypothetical protein